MGQSLGFPDIEDENHCCVGQHAGYGAGQSPEDRGITLLWEYNTDLFDDSTITRMIGHYEALLKRFVADYEMNSGKRLPVALAPPTDKRVAVVGGGPAGFCAAVAAAREGADVVLLATPVPSM